MRHHTYAGDPYWITVRYEGTCAKCGVRIKKGERAFYYPKGKFLYSGPCAHAASADFESLAYDEEVYSGGRY